MRNIESLRSLQKRIREATGPDRELDWDIAKALDASFSAPPYLTDAPEFTLDPDGLGPCVALMREVLPGCEWKRDANGNWFVFYTPTIILAWALPLPNDCLRFLDAILSALIAQEEAKERGA